jgi:hypothetical protein
MCNGSVTVTADSHKGKFFSVFAFNNFATSLADASLQKGDFIAFRSPYIEQNTRHSIEQNCHGLQVRMGIPPRTGAKIFFVRNSKVSVNVLIGFYMFILNMALRLAPTM